MRRLFALVRPLVIPLFALLYVSRCLHFNYISDDAFISFRYARNVARGLGFVFNPGERIEGYTNFLTVAILAALHRAGGDIVFLGRALSIASGVGMVAATFVLAKRMSRSAPVAAASALLIATNPFAAVWGSSGLETTMFGFLLLLMLLQVSAGRVGRRQFFWSSVWALCLGLTRPEGVILYAIAAGLTVLESDTPYADTRRRLAPGLFFYLSLGGAYFVWRWTYFGSPLPNTFIAKSSLSLPQVRLGLGYIAAFLTHPLNLLMLVFAVEGVTSYRLTRIPAVILSSMVAVVALEGGDGLPMYRFLVPAIPLLAIFAVLGIQRFIGALDWQSRRGIVACMTVVLLACLSLFPRRDAQFRLFADQRDYEIPAWRAAGLTLRTVLPPGSLVAAVPIGALGWYSDLPVLDMVGLTDAVIARAPADPGIPWPGHQKHNGAYVVARRPAAILLGNICVDASPEWPGVPLSDLSASFLAREGDILNDPVFGAAYEAATVPVGEGRYLHYYRRRDLDRARR